MTIADIKELLRGKVCICREDTGDGENCFKGNPEDIPESMLGEAITSISPMKANLLYIEIKLTDEEVLDMMATPKLEQLVKVPCETVYFVVDNHSKYATVMKRSIQELALYEIEGIDRKGKYWSTKERAEAAKMTE